MSRSVTIRLPIRLAVLGCLLALVGGCGDGSNQGLTTSEYREQANEICAQQVRDIESIPQPDHSEDLGAWTQAAANRSRPHVQRQRQLEPPSSLQELHEEGIAIQ